MSGRTTVLLYNILITMNCFLTVAIVEVERLWLRFQQLGCNSDGVLQAADVNKSTITKDIFAKNVSINVMHCLIQTCWLYSA